MGTVDFTVEGAGQFPIDMLRYDQAFPYSQSDSMSIGLRPREKDYNKRRRVRLTTHAGNVTQARWQSFMWHVVSRT